MLLYILDLFGVAVFAASGALAGIAAKFDLLGIFVLASITAVGGGTIRDLLLNKHPIFWIRDPWPIYTILATALATIVWVHFLPIPFQALQIADAFGLALFALSGAQIAEKAGYKAIVVILMGTLTGSGGGVLRDLLSAKVPLILHSDIYATAAIAGIIVYLLLRKAGMATVGAFLVGAAAVAATRIAAISYGWNLPVFSMPS